MGTAGANRCEHEDGRLIRNIAQSDVGALQTLYDRYGRLVLSLAYEMLQDRQVAREVAQETFLAIWRGASAFDPARGRPQHWILSLARHVSLYVASRRPSDPGGTRTETTDDAGVVAYAMRAVQGVRVQQALDALPAEQRTVLVLAYYGGYTEREIADRTGAPIEAIKIWALAGLRHLHAALESDREGIDS